METRVSLKYFVDGCSISVTRVMFGKVFGDRYLQIQLQK